jgi:hypothetical protein
MQRVAHDWVGTRGAHRQPRIPGRGRRRPGGAAARPRPPRRRPPPWCCLQGAGVAGLSAPLRVRQRRIVRACIIHVGTRFTGCGVYCHHASQQAGAPARARCARPRLRAAVPHAAGCPARARAPGRTQRAVQQQARPARQQQQRAGARGRAARARRRPLQQLHQPRRALRGDPAQRVPAARAVGQALGGSPAAAAGAGCAEPRRI